MKHTENKNDFQQSDLIQPSAGAKPISSSMVSTVQLAELLPFAKVDENFLRNRAREINPRTGTTWIPKPRAGKYEINPTILGLLEWYCLKSADNDGLPNEFASMQAMENSFLGTPKEFTKWAIKHGATEAQHESNRINPRPIIAKANEILRLIPTGNVTGIDGLKEWNKDQELAKKLYEERLALEDQRRTREGDLKCEADVDAILWEKRDQPLRAALLNTPKSINRQHKTILKGDGEIDEKIRKCADVVTDTIRAVLDKLRTKIPKPLDENQDQNEK